MTFLAFFDIHSRVVKTMFRAAFHASLDFAVETWGRPKQVPKDFLSKKHKEEAGLFFEVFTPKKGAI